MGKGPKPFKVKTYKPPPEKFLVVVNPWGFTNDLQKYINAMCGWFEVMMRAVYPKERPKVLCVYHMGTHKDFILELPSLVKDIRPFLGLHFYQSFLANHAASVTDAAVVYEYNYSRFDHPERRNWQASFPSYSNLPPNFPVRDPYPPSVLLGAPKPPPNAPYAIPVPEPVPEGPPLLQPPSPSRCNPIFQPVAGPSNTRSAPSPPAPPPPPPVTSPPPNPTPPTREPPPPVPTVAHSDPSTSAFTPYIPPSHHPSHSTLTDARPTKQPLEPPSNPQTFSKKLDIDPYEEEEVAERLLAATPTPGPTLRLSESTGNREVCKREQEEPELFKTPKRERDTEDPPSNSVDAFLQSIITPSAVKHEPSSSLPGPQQRGGTFPPAEKATVKPEPQEESIQHPVVKMETPDDGDDYEPSADLLAALEGLDPAMLGVDSTMTQASAPLPTPPPHAPATIRVKAEPRDDDNLLRGDGSSRRTYQTHGRDPYERTRTTSPGPSSCSSSKRSFWQTKSDDMRGGPETGERRYGDTERRSWDPRKRVKREPDT